MAPLPHNLEYVPQVYAEYEPLTQERLKEILCVANASNLSKNVVKDDISAASEICDRPSSPLPPIEAALTSASSISTASSDNLFLKDTKMILNERMNTNIQPTSPEPTTKGDNKSSFQTALDTLIEVFTRNCLILNNGDGEDRYYPDPTSLEINLNDSEAETLSSISTPSKMGGPAEEYYLPWVDM